MDGDPGDRDPGDHDPEQIELEEVTIGTATPLPAVVTLSHNYVNFSDVNRFIDLSVSEEDTSI